MTPTLIVPGLGLGGESWAPTLQALAHTSMEPGEIGVAPLPGYGLPAGRHEDLTPVALAGTLLERFAEGTSHLLIGHSAGCQVVVHAAASAPELVAGVVLVGPTTDPRAMSWRRLVGRWLATARHEASWQVPSLLRQYRRTGPLTMLRTMDAARRDRIDLALRDVDCPVLVLRGREDRIAPADWAESLVAQPRRRSGGRTDPRSAAITLRAGAHMVPTTHPELVAPVLLDFWRRNALG